MAQGSPSGSGDSPRKRSRLGRPEKLEDRILLSATWADADTGDPLDGATEGDDRFEGTGANEIASGLGGDDDLFGGGGSDELFGGGGNDTIDGGEGDDVAVFSGSASDFNITAEPDGSYTVTDLRADAPDGTDGVDSVTDVETFRFADGDLHTPSSLGLDATADTNASVDARDPVAHWQFDADGVSDRVGDHDGSYVGDAGQNDVESRSASFDGSGDYVEIPHSSDFELDGGTVELTFRTDDADAKQGLFSKDSSNYDDGGHLTVWVNDGGIEVRLQSDDASFWVKAEGVVEDGEWTDVQVSFGDGGLHLFVNGELADSNSYSGGLGSTSGGSGNTEPIVIGANAWQSGDGTANNLKDYFQGEIADVAILADQLDVPDPADLSPTEIGLPADSGISNTDTHEVVSHLRFTGSGVSDLIAESEGSLEGGAVQGDTDGRSAVFDGSNDYAELPHSDDLLVDNGRIELSFNSNDVDHKQALFSKDSSGYDDGGHITAWIDDGRVEIRIQSDSASYTLRSDAILSDNTWHDVAFEFGENGAKLIVDGVEQDTDAYTGGLGTSSGGSGNTEPIVIGANQWSSGDGVANNIKDHFEGRIADVAIYAELPQPDVVTLDADVDDFAIDGVTQIVEGDRSFTVDPGDASVTLSYDVDSDRLTLEVVGGSSPISITDSTGAAIDTIQVTGDIAGLESTADIGTLSIDATASIGSLSVGEGDGSIDLVEFTPGVVVNADAITIDADITSVTAQGFASDITLNGEVTNLTVADSITSGAQVTINGVVGEVVVASEINGDSGLAITGHASAVEIGSEVDDNASVSLSSVGELVLGKVDSNASVSISGDATSVEITGRGIDSDLNGSLTIGGSVQQIDIGDDVGGTLDIGGDVTSMTLGDDIKSDARVTVGGDVGTISVPDAIKEGSVVAVAGHVETLEVGNTITGGASVTVGSAGSFSTGTIETTATVEILGDVTSVSLTGNGTNTDLAGSLTIDGSAGSIDIGDDIMGELEVDGDIGTLTVGDDIKDGAIVHVGGDVTAISIADVMRENATLTVDGHVESLEVVDGVTDGASVALGGVDEVTIGQLESGTSFVVSSDAGTITITGLGSDSDLDGTMTIGGSAETIDIGNDLSGDLRVTGNVGSLILGDDFYGSSASAHIGGDVGLIELEDLDRGASLTVDGHVDTLTVNDKVDNATIAVGSAGVIEAATLSSGASIDVAGDIQEIRFSNDAADGTSVRVGRATGPFTLVDGDATHSHEFDELTTVLYDGSSLTMETADLEAGLVLHLDFSDGDDLGADRSGLGNSGDVESVDSGTGSGVFDGSDIIRIPSDSDINTTTVTERTVSVRFKPDSVDGRGVVYEEGGSVRGLNIYVDNGEVMVGGYNIQDNESDWNGTFLSAGTVEAGEWVTITVTLDAGPEVTDDALTVYRGGEEVASGEGSQLWNHPDPGAVGGVNNDTVFHDGTVYDGGYHFTGEIDDLRVYNRAVNDLEIAALADSDASNDPIGLTGLVEQAPSVAENAGSGAVVGTLDVNDTDEGETFTFSLVADADGRFEVDEHGQVTVASGASFDHETEPTISITAQVEDSAGRIETVDIEIAISDVNEPIETVVFTTDAEPVEYGFEDLAVGTNPTSIDFGEGLSASVTQADAQVSAIISVTDGYGATATEGTQFWKILGGETTLDFNEPLAKIELSYTDYDRWVEIEFRAGDEVITFDSSTSKDGTLVIEAPSGQSFDSLTIEWTGDNRDGLGLDRFTLTPANGQPDISESASEGTVVGSLNTADPDNNDSFEYSLTEDADGRFEIDADGRITVASGASFDHETEPSITLTAHVEDSAGHTKTIDIDVAISDFDEMPASISIDGGSVAENAPPGTVVATASATDPEGEALTYSLIDDADGRFVIDSATGVVTVAEGADLDHESGDSFEITVAATDATSGHIAAAETFESGTDGWTSSSGDAYTTTTELSNGDTLLRLGGTGGEQGVSKVFETDASMPYTVIEADLVKLDSWDEGWNEENETFTVFVDGEPAFTFQPQGSTDNGNGQDYASGTNGNISWTVTSNGEDTDLNGRSHSDRVYEVRLVIDGPRESLELGFGTTLTQSLSDESLGINNITIASTGDPDVAASDLEENTATDPERAIERTVTISVTEVNEPIQNVSFTPGGTITETSAAGVVVGSLNATDPDNNENFEYSLTEDADGRFEVDANGQITIASGASFDHETEPSITLTAQVEDSAGHTKTVDIDVAIGDVNEAPTVVLEAFSIGEGGTLQLSVQASDAESDTLTYSWRQVSGPEAPLNDESLATPELVAPRVNEDTRLEFEVTVSDGDHDVVHTVTVDVQSLDVEFAIQAIEGETVDEGETVQLGVAITYNPTPEPAIDFGTVDIDSHGGSSQDTDLSYTTEDTTIHLEGNGWKSIPMPITITADTILELEFRVGEPGEIQGIGFDSDGNVRNDNSSTTFRLDGTQDWGIGVEPIEGEPTEGWATYRIHVGEHFTGDFDRLVLVNDDDAQRTEVSSSFRNVRVFEDVRAPTSDVELTWEQTGGPTVSLDDPNAQAPSFTSPDVDEPTELMFRVTAFDGEQSRTDEVTVLVNPVTTGASPVDNTPVDNTPVDNTPVDNTPVDNTPVDNTPVDNTPVDNTPVDNTPVDNTPVDNTPVDNTAVDNTAVDNTPVDNTPVDNTPVDNTPVDNTDEQSDRILADRAQRDIDASIDRESIDSTNTTPATSDALDRAAQAANTFRDQLGSRSAPDGAEDAIDRAEADARELVGIAEDAADGVGAGDGLVDQPFELSAADRPVQLSEIEADRPFVLDVSPIDLEPVTDGTVLGTQTTRTDAATDEHSDLGSSRDEGPADVARPGIAALFWHLVRGLTGRTDDSNRKER